MRCEKVPDQLMEEMYNYISVKQTYTKNEAF